MSYTDKSLATEGEFALPCAAFLHHEQFVVAGSGWYAPTRVPSRAVSKMPLVVDKRLPQLCHIGEKDNLLDSLSLRCQTWTHRTDHDLDHLDPGLPL